MKENAPEITEMRKLAMENMPQAAFRPNAARLIPLLSHVILFLLSIYTAAKTENTLLQIICILIGGNSSFCIGNIAHYLSHKSIVRNTYILYPLEILSWALVLTPATVWKQKHNVAHHRNTNGIDDSFRYFTKSEATPARTLVQGLFFPNRHLKYNPLALFSYMLILSYQILAALFGFDRKSSPIVATVPDYSAVKRIQVWLELIPVISIQVALYQWFSPDFLKYLIIVGSIYSFGMLISTLILFSQHATLPLDQSNNPIQGSISLNENRLFDLIYSNVGCHVEHHLFEAMDYAYYSELRKILKQHYPNHYKQHSLLDSWKSVQKNDIYKEDYPNFQ